VVGLCCSSLETHCLRIGPAGSGSTKALFVHIKSKQVVPISLIHPPTMRLTLATSALLAFPTVSSSEFQNHEVITKRAKSAGQLRMLKNTLFYKNRYAAQRGNPAGNASNRQAFSMPRHTGVLKTRTRRRTAVLYKLAPIATPLPPSSTWIPAFFSVELRI
jgi:hypothetical protein